ncbi:MAG: hypothetical protein KTV45_09570, partial [Acidimicrobiia bacterium]|nr:hypothetical protein [Acidimicrobiia bacterium]
MPTTAEIQVGKGSMPRTRRPSGLPARISTTGRVDVIATALGLVTPTPLVVCRGFGWVVEGCASSLDFFDDFLGGFVPDEGFGVLVPVVC